MAKQRFENPSDPSQTIPVGGQPRTAASQRSILARQRKAADKKKRDQLADTANPRTVDRGQLAETNRRQRKKIKDNLATRLDRSRLISRLEQSGDIEGANRLRAQSRAEKGQSDIDKRQVSRESRLFRTGAGDLPVEQQRENLGNLNRQKFDILNAQGKQLVIQLKDAVDPEEKRQIAERLQQVTAQLNEPIPFQERTPRIPTDEDESVRQRILGRQGQAAVNKQLEDQRFLIGATVASAGQQARLNEAQSRLTESSLAADLGQSTRDARFEAGQAGVEEKNTRAQIALNQARADAENQPGNIAAQQNLLKAENDARIAQANAAGGEAGRAERRGAAGEEGQLQVDRAKENKVLSEIQEETESLADDLGFDTKTDVGFTQTNQAIDSVSGLVTSRTGRVSPLSNKNFEESRINIESLLAGMNQSQKSRYSSYILDQIEIQKTDSREDIADVFKNLGVLEFTGGANPSNERTRFSAKYRKFIERLRVIAKE